MKPPMSYGSIFEQLIKATSFVDTLCWRFPGVYLKPSVARFLRFLATPRRHYLFPAEMAEDTSLSEIFFQTIDNCFARLEFVSQISSNVLLLRFFGGQFCEQAAGWRQSQTKTAKLCRAGDLPCSYCFFPAFVFNSYCSCSLF